MPLHPSAANARPTRKTEPNPFVGEANPALGQQVRPPRDRLADDPVPPDVAYQLIHDELLLDGSSRLNLATFVTTWMEPQARVLMAECVDKNMIDKDEYPQTAEPVVPAGLALARPALESQTGCPQGRAFPQLR